MPTTNTEKYRNQIERVRADAELGIISDDSAEAMLAFARAFDRDEADDPLPHRDEMYPTSGRKVKHTKAGTRTSYLSSLKRVAAFEELTDPDITATDLNKTLRALIHGDMPSPIADELEATDSVGRPLADRYKQSISHTTAESMARVLAKFFRWYSIDHETAVNVHRINDFEAPDGHADAKGWGPRDMLEPEEEQDMWDACRSSLERAYFYTLRWTGMRKTALRWLKWGDVDFGAGVYYFPTTGDGEGLKHLAEPEAPRPLLHAEKALRAWADDHPDSDDPEAHVFTSDPRGPAAHHYDPTGPVGDSTPNRTLAKVAKRADVTDKPTYPHMMRHNYVTTLKSVWGVDDSTIKWLIGHTPDSQVMETTYSHLSADDHHDEVLVAGGFREPDEAKADERGDTCGNCGNHTDPTEAFCGTCGRAQDVNAWLRQEAREDRLGRDTTEAALEASTDRERDGVRAAAEVQQAGKRDPEHAALLEAVAQLQEQNERMADRLEELEADEEPDAFDPETHSVADDLRGRADD